MSDQSTPRSGQVSVTPEGGPVNQGAPPSGPGMGQVLPTPEAGLPSASDQQPLTPPTWDEHMRGPILGLDDVPEPAPAAASAASPAAASSPPTSAAAREEPATRPGAEPGVEPHAEPAAADEAELKQWPPYSGKPVSDLSEVRRYAAPVVAQAEKLAIKAIDLSGRGLSRLARLLEERRTGREGESDSSR